MVFGVGRGGSPSRPRRVTVQARNRPARRSAPTTFPCTYALAKHTRKSGRRSDTGERVSRRFDSQPSARAKKTANICRSFRADGTRFQYPGFRFASPWAEVCYAFGVFAENLVVPLNRCAFDYA